jgi:DNA polymerase-3 subunit alpha
MDITKYKNESYINFHVHSIGSLRDGIITVSQHAKFAVANGKKFVPVTDHGSVSEWIELYNECKKHEVTPIYGIELYVVENRKKFMEDKNGKPNHLCLFALNEDGFYNIIKIHNDAWQNHYKKPIADYQFLFENSNGIVASTACMAGSLARHLMEKDIASADEFALKMKEVFGDRFFIELMLIDMAEQKELNEELIKCSIRNNISTIITNDAHYLKPEHNKAHQISLLMQSNQTIKDLESGKGWKFSAQDLWLKNERDLLKDLLNDYKGNRHLTLTVFEQSMENCRMITDRIEEIYLEHPPRLPKFEEGEAVLREMIKKGYNKKLDREIIPIEKQEEYLSQIKKELRTIKDLELTDYFLLIKDIVDFCHKEDIGVGPGRGSVSASLVTWLIDITKLDSIKHGFMFERFLNVARKTQMDVFWSQAEDEKEYKRIISGQKSTVPEGKIRSSQEDKPTNHEVVEGQSPNQFSDIDTIGNKKETKERKR